MDLLIIGGSDAGISAALRARELRPEVKVRILIADAFANYSICGLPFYVSGEVVDWRDLAHRSHEELAQTGIELSYRHVAGQIDVGGRMVSVRNSEGSGSSIRYDRLIVATGAKPVRPPIDGLGLPGVFTLHTMEDSFAIHDHLRRHACKSAVIVGGGYIGLEMADALALRGLNVTLVEFSPNVLGTVDSSLGTLVADELRRHGVTVICNTRVEAIESRGDGLVVRGSTSLALETDMIIVAVGVQPETDLARAAGLARGVRDAISVTRKMETSVPAIFAAGDCVETWHHLLRKPTYVPLGTTAHKQGLVAGENAVGGARDFRGSLGTQAVKVFNLIAARTGLRDDEAERAGFKPLTVESLAWDHKAYYPGAHQLHIRVTGDRETGRLLGAQIVGHRSSEVSKRIDIFASALFHDCRVRDLEDFDLSYTPPLSSPWDPVQMGAQAWMRAAQPPQSHEQNS
jgi:NADPH-dependent 2,4-dienoyl-CoA reductase/sulfur reductase-like enzyme